MSGEGEAWTPGSRWERAQKATRRKRTGTRDTGKNPRAKGTNPRAQQTSPEQWLDSTARRTASRVRQALARLHGRGDYWCDLCDDTGWLTHEVETVHGFVQPCKHRPMSIIDAEDIIHG